MGIFHFNTDSLAWRLAAEKSKDEIAEVISSALAANCTIIVMANNQEWTGSGFHVGQGLIVTAAHVVPEEMANGPHQIIVTFDSKTPYRAEVVLSEDKYDAGIIYAADIAKVIPTVTLGDSSKAEVGDIIAVISSPEGWHDTATVGRISNIHQGLGPSAPSEAWNDIIFIDADILQGASGGMVIATDGLVYGSVMGVAGQHADIGIGERSVCPANKIKELLQRIAQHS